MSKFVVNIRQSNYDVYIGRNSKIDPGKWGNKYIIGIDGSREEVVEKHKQDILNDAEIKLKIKKELKGKTLGCFCKGTQGEKEVSCHGDILAQIANED